MSLDRDDGCFLLALQVWRQVQPRGGNVGAALDSLPQGKKKKKKRKTRREDEVELVKESMALDGAS